MVEQTGAVGDEVTAKGPVSDGTLKGNDSEAEVGTADKFSPLKLNEDPEDNQRLEKVQFVPRQTTDSLLFRKT